MNVSQNIQENFVKTRYTCLHRSPISFPPQLGHVPLKKRLTHYYKCKAFYFLASTLTFLNHPLMMLVKALFLS